MRPCFTALVLCGHSLGAGVAALLALVSLFPCPSMNAFAMFSAHRACYQMWATPETCLTHKASGLPVGRRVSSYCFAPPCVVSPRLSAKAAASGLIISFVYGHDIVSRLSLGSVRDLTRGAVWLCAAENRDETRSDGYNNVTKKALKRKVGRQEEGDEEWVSSLERLASRRYVLIVGHAFASSSLPSARRSKRTCRWQTCSLPAASTGHFAMGTSTAHIGSGQAPHGAFLRRRCACSRSAT